MSPVVLALVILLLGLAVFVAVWPLVELANRRRTPRPARSGQVSFAPGIASVRWDATLVDLTPIH